MDKEQARFILRSFRPDGADVNDRDFAEALAMAMENRELGEWLAEERAFDAAFAQALASVALPENLRQDILGCLAGERGDFPQPEDAGDAALSDALASITPPPALRNQILAAMERTAEERAEPAVLVGKPFWQRLAMPLAAAAGVALAFFLTREGGASAVVIGSQLPVEVVQAGFIRAYESPQFRLEEQREDPQALFATLESRKLPCPCCLPRGLIKVKGLGCRELVIDGKRGSLVCFEQRGNGVIHLVIFRREDVSGPLPQLNRPAFAQNGHWASARWEHENKVFILLGDTEVGKLSALF